MASMKTKVADIVLIPVMDVHPVKKSIDSIFIMPLYYGNKMKKTMAIDYGSKRVGIASTDESGSFSLPRAVWPNDGALLEKVLQFKEEEGIDQVVIGESKDFHGDSNPIQEEINKFKGELEKRGIKVISHPEIFTTVEARRLQGQTEMTDASAAALILKNFLESVYNK